MALPITCISPQPTTLTACPPSRPPAGVLKYLWPVERQTQQVKRCPWPASLALWRAEPYLCHTREYARKHAGRRDGDVHPLSVAVEVGEHLERNGHRACGTATGTPNSPDVVSPLFLPQEPCRRRAGNRELRSCCRAHTQDPSTPQRGPEGSCGGKAPHRRERLGREAKRVRAATELRNVRMCAECAYVRSVWPCALGQAMRTRPCALGHAH